MNNTINQLQKYHTINKEIRKLNEDLNDVVLAKLNADGGLRCSRITGLPRGSDTTDTVKSHYEEMCEHYDAVCKDLAEYVDYIRWRINQLIADKILIDECISMLDPDEYRIITLRYVTYPEPKYNWEKVIHESFYGRTRCFEIHKQAVLKITAQMEKSGLNRTKTAV